MRARYGANMAKALEVILWVAKRKPGVDFHKILKILFYADKIHLNRHGRPIAGGRYVADSYGPVCRAVYDILREDPLAVQMLERNGELPIRVNNRYCVEAKRDPNTRVLSRSDVDALSEAWRQYGEMSFDELVKLTHEDPAYLNADGIETRYEDFLDDTPDRQQKAEDLADTARLIAV